MLPNPGPDRCSDAHRKQGADSERPNAPCKRRNRTKAFDKPEPIQNMRRMNEKRKRHRSGQKRKKEGKKRETNSQKGCPIRSTYSSRW